MADPQPVSHSQPQETAASARPGATPSFGTVARRITGWTSNLVATAIVVLLCLGIGHTLLDWSRREPEVLTSPSNPAAHAAAGPLTVEFPGEAGLQRIPATGDRDSIRAQLRQRIEHATRRQAASPGRLQAAAARTPGGQEAKLLAMTENRAVAAAEPDRWELHEFIGTFPLWVGFVQVPGSSDHPGNLAGEPPSPGSQRRLAAWGMAVPSANHHWNLYLQEEFQPDGQTRQQAGRGEAQAAATRNEPAWQSQRIPPLPLGFRRTLALTTEQGEQLIGFAGEAAMDACRAHFDRWAAALDPPQKLRWRGGADHWIADLPAPSTHEAGAAGQTGHGFQLQLAKDARGTVLGLVRLPPPVPADG